MLRPDPSELASQVLAGIVLVAAAFLAWRQWRDYRTRPTELSRLDENHFARQELTPNPWHNCHALFGLGFGSGWPNVTRY